MTVYVVFAISFILQPMNSLLTRTDQNLCANWIFLFKPPNNASFRGFPLGALVLRLVFWNYSYYNLSKEARIIPEILIDCSFCGKGGGKNITVVETRFGKIDHIALYKKFSLRHTGKLLSYSSYSKTLLQLQF